MDIEEESNPDPYRLSEGEDRAQTLKKTNVKTHGANITPPWRAGQTGGTA